MKINLLIIFVSLAVNIHAQVNVKTLNEGIKTYVEKTDFNGRIILWEDDEIILDHMQGYASFEKNQLIDSLTRFNIASVGKMITSLGVLKLIDEGKLNLEDKINTYYPDLPSDITIEQLLNHTSGLQKRTFVIGHNWSKLEGPITNEQFIQYLADEPVRFMAGEKFEYNNVNYILLYDLFEKIKGTTIENYLSKKGYLKSLNTKNNATLHDYNEATGKWVEDLNMVGNFLALHEYNLKGAGHYYLKPSEAIEIISGMKELISQELLDLALTPSPMSEKQGMGYGYGISLEGDGNNSKWFHLGKNHGGRSYLAHFENLDVTLFMVSNFDDSNFNQLRPQLEAIITLNKKFEMPKLSLAANISGKIYSLEPNEVSPIAYGMLASDKYYVSRPEVNDIAYHLWEQGDFVKGIEILKLNSQLHPDNFKLSFYYAEGLDEMGKYTGAYLEYKRALKLMKSQLKEGDSWITVTNKRIEACKQKTTPPLIEREKKIVQMGYDAQSLYKNVQKLKDRSHLLNNQLSDVR